MADWELSKENVEPIKEGRNINSLRTALNRNDSESNKRETIRKEYESELRTYSGCDPLSVYHKYILWIEQNYPEGGNEAKLKTVLENCIQQFFQSEQYQNDCRLLTIFLKFIKRVDSPLELFKYFYENGFGTKLSEFYINWSFHLETHKNTKKAAQVLALGLENCAEPKTALNRAQEELQTRVAKAIASGNMDELNEDLSDEQNRKAFNTLKQKSKKGKSEAPVTRVGNSVKNTKGGLKTCKENKSSQNSNKVPIIYCDENDADLQLKSVPKPETSHNLNHISSVGLENEQKAGKWTENKIKQKPPKVNPMPNFVIHADESDDESNQVLKPPQSNALKVREFNREVFPIARFEKPDPFKRYLFNEKKIYAGGEEFSFEEIRGRKWLADRERQQEVVRSQKLEEEVAQLRKQVELLLISREHHVNSEREPVLNPQVKEDKESCSPMASSADSSAAKSISNGSVSKAAISMMRELWNGTLANNEMPENIQKFDKTSTNNSNDNDCKTNQKFMIYSDTTIQSTKSKQTNDKPSEPRNSLDETGCVNDYTIALPKSEADFIACCASTPMADKSLKRVVNYVDIGVELNNNFNFVGGMTAKLSPIVETSREYNSKSSSSSSGTMSSTGVSAIVRRQRALSGLQNIDPFDLNVLTQLMESLPEAIDSRKGFHRVNKALPKIKKRETTLKLGNDLYLIDRLVATGAYAHVYAAQIDDTSDSYDSDSTNCSGLSKIVSQKWFALKISKPANQWEFYICDELHKRLARSKPMPDIELSVMAANPTVIYKDGSVVVDELVSYGTLINVINVCKKQDKTFSKSLLAYYSLELIQIIQQIHKCEIIHADLKPDNILILNFPMREDVNNVLKRTSSLKVIDFGRSIDMQLLAKGTTFNITVQTKGSQCCEMLDSKPWTYQTDWFGVLDCIHVMLFGDYIKVRKNKSDRWEISEKFKRYHQTDIWEPLFDTLLNIRDCNEMPDLSPFINALNEYVKNNVNRIVKDANDLEILIDSTLKKSK